MLWGLPDMGFHDLSMMKLIGKYIISRAHPITSWLRVSKAIDTSMRLMVRTDALTAANGGLENAIERGKRYMDADYAELFKEGYGFRVIWHTILQARTDMEATWNTFSDLAENGPAAHWRLHDRQRSHPVGDCQKMSNTLPWQQYEQEIGGEEARKRYNKSQGYKGEQAA